MRSENKGATAVAETLLQFPRPIAAPDGTLYEARACGSAMAANMWQGWIEFVPLDGGAPVRSPRETTQPNRTDTEVLGDWVDRRVPRRRIAPRARTAGERADAAAAALCLRPAGVDSADFRRCRGTSILDPFSVYEKGEALLRKQLAALSAWHLVNIAREYELTDLPVETLNAMPGVELIELIVAGVRAETGRRHPA